MNPQDPHADQPITTAGPPLETAKGALILVHGRGATAQGMLGLLTALQAEQFAIIAPQAAGNTWYPNSFLAPIPSNQPYLDSALARLESIVHDLFKRNLPGERIAILGFSQGACLTLEFAARNARRYGAIIGLSGGLIGPPGIPRVYGGTFNETPVLLASSDPDPHVPFQRVEETQNVFEQMNAIVDLRRYPGMPHTVNDDELEACRLLLSQIQ